MTFDDLMKSWETNCSHNLLVYSALSDDELQLSSRKKGRAIEGIIHHVIKNRFDWLTHMKPKIEKYKVDMNKDIKESELVSMNWVKDLILLEKEGKTVKGFKGNLFSFIIYLMVVNLVDLHQAYQILKIETHIVVF